MSDWLNQFPFAWLLIAVLAVSYVAATAIYTRVMMFVIDRRGNVPIAAAEANREVSAIEGPVEIPASDTPRFQIIRAESHNLNATEAEWDRLTAADIEKAKRALAARRAEALIRHADELRVFDAEQGEIDAIETAIDAFARRYKGDRGELVPRKARRITSR